MRNTLLMVEAARHRIGAISVISVGKRHSDCLISARSVCAAEVQMGLISIRSFLPGCLEQKVHDGFLLNM